MALTDIPSIEYLLGKGWRRDYTRDGLVSPKGEFLSFASGADLHSSSYFHPDPPKNQKFSPYNKIKARLDMGVGDEFGFHMNIVVGSTKIFVFVAKDDKALVLEDDPFLFPSDKLVGQLRLWQASIR